MTETAYERGYRVGTEHSTSLETGGARSGSIGGGGALSRQMGPLPVWAWMALGLVLILGVSYWRARKNSTASASASGGTVDTSQVPQFVNQTYVNGVPPSEPDTEPPGPAGPTGPPGPKGPPGPTGKPPSGGKIHVPAYKYVVQKGDTLLSLSQKLLGTPNRTALAHANGLGTGAGLRTGQVLTVPAHDAQTGSSSARSWGNSKGAELWLNLTRM